MLADIGVSSLEDLFEAVPEAVRFKGPLNLPEGMVEASLLRHMKELGGQNQSADELVCFAGGGAYDHDIPIALKTIASRSEFYTAYTPYQAEINQGVLQSIFEYQTLICQLTGLDIANASLYEGASALAEGAIMACAHTNRDKVLMAQSCHPEYRLVVETYLRHQGITVITVPEQDGIVSIDAFNDVLSDEVACFLVQHPNFYGHLEDVHRMSAALHAHGALFVVSVDPISLGILEPPAAYGADIAVGEGQSLGNTLSYGGPYLGFLAAKKELLRRIPGRIVGETVDPQGRRGFTLTLQGREQHIRRHRATSNICTNQALNALCATAYLVLVGKEGLKEAAYLSFQKAHYLERRLREASAVQRWSERPFFKELAVRVDADAKDVEAALLAEGMFAGPYFKHMGLAPEDAMLLCATEARSKEEIDRLVHVLKQL